MIADQPLTKVAYLAGLVDGEGTIGLYRTNRSRNFAPQFAISMRDEVAIREVAKIASHLGVEAPIKARKYKNGTMYKWGTYNKAALSKLIPELLPYLVVKKPQAGAIRCFLALAAGDIRLRSKRILEGIEKVIRALNQRTLIVSHAPVSAGTVQRL